MTKNTNKKIALTTILLTTTLLSGCSIGGKGTSPVPLNGGGDPPPTTSSPSTSTPAKQNATNKNAANKNDVNANKSSANSVTIPPTEDKWNFIYSADESSKTVADNQPLDQWRCAGSILLIANYYDNQKFQALPNDYRCKKYEKLQK